MICRYPQGLCVAAAAQAEQHPDSAEEHHSAAGFRHCGEDAIGDERSARVGAGAAEFHRAGAVFGQSARFISECESDSLLPLF